VSNFNPVTGRNDGDTNTWTWRDEDEPHLVYRQPTAPEVNRYQRARAQYQDRVRDHMEARAEEVGDDVLDEIEEAGEVDPLTVLMAGFHPTDAELAQFVDFLHACTTGIVGFGIDGVALDWDDPKLADHLPPAETAEEARRYILRSLGETPDQRIASIFQYARAVAQGLDGETKKD